MVCCDRILEAKKNGEPIVALESTIISHGMPYPRNVETALRVEQTVRDNGAVPATIAVIRGVPTAGLSPEEIEYLGKKGLAVTKASRRDLPILAARKEDGATTVAATMIIAALAGIEVFCTGGIGGVHRGAETTMDISADLEELSQTPVMVVCAGAKSILDIGLTLEYLETKGVPVIGYGTRDLPAFYTRKSGKKSLPHILPSAGLVIPAGCSLPIRSRKNTPWTATISPEKSKTRSGLLRNRVSGEKPLRRSCLIPSRRLPAVKVWKPISSSC